MRRCRVKTFDIDGRFAETARPEKWHDLARALVVVDVEHQEMFEVVTDIRGMMGREHGAEIAATWSKLIVGAFPELEGRQFEDLCAMLIMKNRGHRKSCLQQRSGHSGHSSCLVDMIEYWAGTANLTKEHVKAGLTCTRFDVAYSKQHDCTTNSGLRLWLEEMLCMAKGGLVWCGTKCSPFLLMCVSKSKRRAENGYVG